MSMEGTALILAWVAILMLAFAMSGLVRQVHSLASRDATNSARVGPTVGSAAPHLDNGQTSFPSVYLFMDDQCSTCRHLLDELPSLAPKGSSVPVTLIFAGAPFADSDVNLRMLSHKADVFAKLNIPVTPFGMAVSIDGRITRAEPVGSPEMLQEFLETSDLTRHTRRTA